LTDGLDVGQRYLLMRVKPDPSRSHHSLFMKHLLPMVILACVALSGCSSLLPRSSSDTDGRFSTFESAQAAAQRIVPMQTQVSELKGLGFDPDGGANVILISLGPFQPAGEGAGAMLMR
jgi:hypothetical protein